MTYNDFYFQKFIDKKNIRSATANAYAETLKFFMNANNTNLSSFCKK